MLLLFQTSSSTLDGMSEEEKEIRTYHTLNLPLRSILKNSPSGSKLKKKSASYSDLQGRKEITMHVSLL